MRFRDKFFLWVAEHIKEAALARSRETIKQAPCGRPKNEQLRELDVILKSSLPEENDTAQILLRVRVDALDALQTKGIKPGPFLTKALNRQLHQISAALIDY